MSSHNGQLHGITVQKGGVGKSTFSQALAYSFSNQGYKTALVDLDPQSTLTGAFFGYTYGAFTQNEVNGILKYDVSNITNLFRSEPVEPIIITTTKYIDNPNKRENSSTTFSGRTVTNRLLPF